jgi:hypothetical protein
LRDRVSARRRPKRERSAANNPISHFHFMPLAILALTPLCPKGRVGLRALHFILSYPARVARGKYEFGTSVNFLSASSASALPQPLTHCGPK